MAMPVWTDAETQAFLNLKDAGKTYKEIGELLYHSFGFFRSEDSLKNKWRNTDWEQFKVDRVAKSQALEEKTLKDAEKEKIIETTLANNERIIRREQARTEVIVDNLLSSIYRLPKPKPSDWTYSPKDSSKYTAEHVGVMVSDMHVGATYSLDDTGGLAEYNLSIFKRRLKKLEESVLEITERHRMMYDLPELHIFSLGDVIAGAPGCGAWSPKYIDLATTDQLTEGFQGLYCLVGKWAQAFSKVHFYGIYGNHGRVGKKGENKSYDNWDRVCYEILKIALTNYDNIEWHIPKAWWLNPQIQGHSFYLCHGDGIRGSMGIPYYGVERAEAKIAGLMEQSIDYVLMGHFHTPAEIQTNSSRVMMNGSFMGGDMYSLQDLRSNARPEQKIFGIHKKKGITWTYNIYLDGE